MLFDKILIDFDVSTAAPTARHSARGFTKRLSDLLFLLKIYQKSLKNHPKIHQKSTKIHQKSTKNLLKSALGASWAPRGPKTPPRPFQARKQGALSPPHRAPFWKDFGAMLAPRATKRPLKKHTKFSLIWKSICHRFFIDLGRVLGGSWSQVGLQNPLKIGSRCWPNFYLNFDRSRNAFYWILPRSWKAEGAKSIEKK